MAERLTVAVEVDYGKASPAALPFGDDEIGVIEVDASDEVKVAAGHGRRREAGVLNPERRCE